MKAVRIILIVLGVILISTNLLNDIQISDYSGNNGTGYFVGYVVGSQATLLIGILFLVSAHFINQRLKRKRKN